MKSGYTNSQHTDIHIRNMNPNAWRLAKAEAALADVSIAEWLRRAIISYAAQTHRVPDAVHNARVDSASPDGRRSQ
ncbi:MAG: hypothetical protein HYY32_06475 [Chloroflexi bacterium]|nr:hypothetical protein [Chloroflexota bacterium]